MSGGETEALARLQRTCSDVQYATGLRTKHEPGLDKLPVAVAVGAGGVVFVVEVVVGVAIVLTKIVTIIMIAEEEYPHLAVSSV